MKPLGIPEHKRALMMELYLAGETAACILAALNAMPGAVTTWRQVKSFTQFRKIFRPTVIGFKAQPRVWSETRKAIVLREYAGGMSVPAIIALLNAEPGSEITFDAFRQQLQVLKIGRNTFAHLQIARAIGVSNREALDAMAWARKRGIPLDGSPLAVAARIAAAVQMVAA